MRQNSYNELTSLSTLNLKLILHVKQEKLKEILDQNFSKAADLRNMEKVLEKECNINYIDINLIENVLKERLREIKINNILDKTF